jgi:hypothetical protein
MGKAVENREGHGAMEPPGFAKEKSWTLRKESRGFKAWIEWDMGRETLSRKHVLTKCCYSRH